MTECNIKKASPETIAFLLKIGILEIGDDGRIHVKENTPTMTAKSEQGYQILENKHY